MDPHTQDSEKPVDASEFIAQLRADLGTRAATDLTQLGPCTVDRSGHRATGFLLAAVSSESIDDVQTVCRVAHRYRVPVVTRGAGTGLAGGAIAGVAEVGLLLDQMNQFIDISAGNRLAIVQPGILNGDLNRRLAEDGLWWALV